MNLRRISTEEPHASATIAHRWRLASCPAFIQSSSITSYQLLADGVMLLHLGFVLFVVFGGLLALRWPKVAWFHLPAATWGATVEFTGWICPLTPLEVWLRLKGEESGYDADFIAQYVLPVLYPAGLTHEVQIVLGSFVVAANMIVYSWLWRRQFNTPSL